MPAFLPLGHLTDSFTEERPVTKKVLQRAQKIRTFSSYEALMVPSRLSRSIRFFLDAERFDLQNERLGVVHAARPDERGDKQRAYERLG